MARWTLILVAVAFALVFLVLPIVNVFAQAVSHGLSFLLSGVMDDNSIHAIKLTMLISALTVPLNALFGLVGAWAIGKFQFRGKALLLTLIDLPFAISPVVVGLMFIILFGRRGYFGEWFEANGMKIIFALPGQVLVTLFITFPLIVRELLPVMEASGSEPEQAALTLGASGWQTFWRVTLPSMKWGLLYGIILCNARAMGEFGAVFIVTSSVAGKTQTIPLRIFELMEGAELKSTVAAFGMASILVLLALVTLGLKTWLERRQHLDESRAQEAPPAP